MKGFTRVIMPCVAFAAMLAACDSTDNTTGITTSNTANVRFVNALSGSSGNLALTANGSMVGSSQALANSNSTFTCSSIPAGSNALAFGTANTGGTGIASSLGTMNSTFTSGGNYTLIATGTTANPQLMILPNTSTTTAGTGFANVQFVNATSVPVDFFANTSSATQLGTPTISGTSAFGSTNGTFTLVPITNGSLTFTQAGTSSPLLTTTGTFTSGGNYTVLLLPGTGGVGFQTLILNGSC